MTFTSTYVMWHMHGSNAMHSNSMKNVCVLGFRTFKCQFRNDQQRIFRIRKFKLCICRYEIENEEWKFGFLFVCLLVVLTYIQNQFNKFLRSFDLRNEVAVETWKNRPTIEEKSILWIIICRKKNWAKITSIHIASTFIGRIQIDSARFALLQQLDEAKLDDEQVWLGIIRAFDFRCSSSGSDTNQQQCIARK